MSSAYSNEARITSRMYEPACACTQRYGRAEHVFMYITLMNDVATESEDEIHPLTVTCT